MIKSQTKDKLMQLKLNAFVEVLEEITANTSCSLSVGEALDMMVDREMVLRDNRRLVRLLKTAKLRYPSACAINIDYHQKRQFNQELLRQLTHCQCPAQHLKAARIPELYMFLFMYFDCLTFLILKLISCTISLVIYGLRGMDWVAGKVI